jgi:hypothetical protein
MDPGMDASERLDRHALVMAIWFPAGFVAVALLHKGIALDGGAGWIAAGYAAILAAFVAHIVANAVLGTGFSAGETALGAAGFALAVLSLLLAALVGSLAADQLLAAGIGLAVLLAAVIAYLLIAFGPRQALAKFDVIRDNNPRATSRLTHRGGRR